MARKEIYKVTQPKFADGSLVPNQWKVFKGDLDFNPTGAYDVSRSGTSMFCACFAGNKEICRHRTMIELFDSEGRINTHWWYEFDRERWIEGPKADEGDTTP